MIKVEMRVTMVEQKDKKQLYVLFGCSVFVLAVSIWAFKMEINTTASSPTGIEDHSSHRDKAGESGQKKDAETLDIDAFAETVLEKVPFDTTLEKMDDSVTQSMITTASDKTKVVLYMGEGTSADELLIMTVNDESRMDPEIENVQQHLTDMQQSFQDYLPKEAKKIDDAVILQSGKYIVACVCSDKDTAGSVIREQLKGKK